RTANRIAQHRQPGGATRARRRPARHASLANTVFGKLGSKGIAIHAEHVRSLRLVAAGAMHDHRQQRSFDVGDHHVVDPARLLAVEPLEIFVQRFFDAAANLVPTVGTDNLFHAARASSTHEAPAGETNGRHDDTSASRSSYAASWSKKRSTSAICAADESTRLI